MMGLRVDRRGQAVVRFPKFLEPWVRARYLAPYRDGVFHDDPPWPRPQLHLHSVLPRPKDEADARDCHQQTGSYQVRGLDWQHRLSERDQERRSKLVACLAAGGSREIPLPNPKAVPVLGKGEGHLIAVYSHEVLQLVGSEWHTLHVSEQPMPVSGLPPLVMNGRLFLRDEGDNEDDKHLWVIDLSSKSVPKSLDEQTGLTGSYGPRWETCMSYVPLPDGTVWASLGDRPNFPCSHVP